MSATSRPSGGPPLQPASSVPEHEAHCFSVHVGFLERSALPSSASLPVYYGAMLVDGPAGLLQGVPQGEEPFCSGFRGSKWLVLLPSQLFVWSGGSGTVQPSAGGSTRVS